MAAAAAATTGVPVAKEERAPQRAGVGDRPVKAGLAESTNAIKHGQMSVGSRGEGVCVQEGDAASSCGPSARVGMAEVAVGRGELDCEQIHYAPDQPTAVERGKWQQWSVAVGCQGWRRSALVDEVSRVSTPSRLNLFLGHPPTLAATDWPTVELRDTPHHSVQRGCCRLAGTSSVGLPSRESLLGSAADCP